VDPGVFGDNNIFAHFLRDGHTSAAEIARVTHDDERAQIAITIVSFHVPARELCWS